MQNERFNSSTGGGQTLSSLFVPLFNHVGLSFKSYGERCHLMRGAEKPSRRMNMWTLAPTGRESGCCNQFDYNHERGVQIHKNTDCATSAQWQHLFLNPLRQKRNFLTNCMRIELKKGIQKCNQIFQSKNKLTT